MNNSGTSSLNKNAFRSSNRKELPADIVCAVSPAQNIPFGFPQIDRNTMGGLEVNKSDPD